MIEDMNLWNTVDDTNGCGRLSDDLGATLLFVSFICIGLIVNVYMGWGFVK